MRRCNRCRLLKPLEDFHNNRHDKQNGRQWTCKECNSARNKARYQEMRLALISHLGGRCACCTESEPVFLQIDHVFGSGGTERKRVNSIHHLTRRVHSSPGEFQLLCGNCHAAKSSNVECPHKRRERDARP